MKKNLLFKKKKETKWEKEERWEREREREAEERQRFGESWHQSTKHTHTNSFFSSSTFLKRVFLLLWILLVCFFFYFFYYYPSIFHQSFFIRLTFAIPISFFFFALKNKFSTFCAVMKLIWKKIKTNISSLSFCLFFILSHSRSHISIPFCYLPAIGDDKDIEIEITMHGIKIRQSKSNIYFKIFLCSMQSSKRSRTTDLLVLLKIRNQLPRITHTHTTKVRIGYHNNKLQSFFWL